MLGVFLPECLPDLDQLLSDYSATSAVALARTFDVSRSTAHRWITTNKAPRAVLLALYMASVRYGGRQTLGAIMEAERRQALHRDYADSLLRDLESTRREFSRVLAAADFGCANDVISEPVAWAIEAERRKRPLKLVSA